MSWETDPCDQLLTGELRELWRACALNPPLPVRPGMPLADVPIDHLAIALTDVGELREWSQRLQSAGILHMEDPVHLWPDEAPDAAGHAHAPADAQRPARQGAPCVEDKKYIVRLRGKDCVIVLLAPHGRGDVIDRFLQANGGPGVHHVAMRVADVKASSAALEALPGARRITQVAADAAFTQVFFKFGEDPRIIELIQKEQAAKGTTTSRNVGVLTAGERGDLNRSGRSG